MTVEQLATLMSQCPHIYTVDDYGATDPNDLESAPYYMPAAAWLLPRLGLTAEPSEAMIEAATAAIQEALEMNMFVIRDGTYALDLAQAAVRAALVP